MPVALQDAGYEVWRVDSLQAGADVLHLLQPALIIVSGEAAATLYEALRPASAAPILALLTQPSETQTLAALNAGADDCQPASISTQEVLGRVRTLLRRASGAVKAV